MVTVVVITFIIALKLFIVAAIIKTIIFIVIIST